MTIDLEIYMFVWINFGHHKNCSICHLKLIYCIMKILICKYNIFGDLWIVFYIKIAMHVFWLLE
jgi:hypothetical protein